MIDWLKDESGGASVEYGLLLSLIFLAIIAAVTAFANSVTTNLYGLAVGLFPH